MSDSLIYHGLSLGESEKYFKLQDVNNHQEAVQQITTKQNKRKKSNKTKIISSDSINSLDDKMKTKKGPKTMAHERKIDRSSSLRLERTPRGQSHYQHTRYDTPLSYKFLEPDIQELCRQLSLKDTTELNLSNRNLKTLNYDYDDIKERKIYDIDVSLNRLEKVPECLQIASVLSISLASNCLRTVDIEHQMSSLSVLVLSSNRIRKFPSHDVLDRMPNLQKLVLYNNAITALPNKSLMKLAEIGLTELDLSFNHLQIIPETIGNIKTLKSLKLANNKLHTLPRSIVLITQLEGVGRFDVSENKLTTPPQAVASKGFSAVQRYFKLLPQEDSKTVMSNQYKVIVVGHEGAGKTSCIRCLTRSIVKIKRNGFESCFGRLIGMHDKGRYEVEPFGDMVRLTGTENDDDLSDSLMLDDEDESEITVGRTGKTLILDRNELEICTSVRTGDCGANEWTNPPQSTVGIDISTWRPAVTYSLLTSPISSSSFADDNIDRPVSGGHPKSYAQALVAPVGPSLAELEGFGAYEPDPSVDLIRGFGSYSLNSPGEHRSRHKDKPGNHNNRSHGHYRTAHDSKNGGREFDGKPPDNLTLSIWDFAGQDIYHAAHEAFFSTNALYLVVWDMNKNDPAQMDIYVQFWIDLIQARAPGSTIIVVGTRSDEVRDGGRFGDHHHGNRHNSPDRVDSICRRLHRRLEKNDEERKNSIKRDCEKEGSNQPLLKRLVKLRPNIVGVVPVSCTEGMEGFNILTALILRLSTPSHKDFTPFQLVNLKIPKYYREVKDVVESLMRDNKVTTMVHLHELVNQHSQRSGEAEVSIKYTRDAVTVLSSVGEVVWFGCPENSHRIGVDDLQHSAVTTSADTISVKHVHSETDQVLTSCAFDCAAGVYSDLSDDERNCDRNSEGSLQRVNDCLWHVVGESEANNRLLSDVVFLSPHWLLQGLKRILTHHIADDISNLRGRMTQSELQLYFGDNYEEHMSNGVLKWQFIEEKLLNDIDLPTNKEIRDLVLSALRSVMQKYDVIIPLTLDHPVYQNGERPEEYCGANNTHLPSMINSSSCVVTWQSILEALLRDIDLSANKEAQHIALSALRSVMQKHGITLPSSADRPKDIHGEGSDEYIAANTTHVQSTKMSLSCDDLLCPASGDEFFLVPALLNPSDQPVIPQYASSGFVKLERKFILGEFLPPGLLQRTMAKTYFEFGNIKHSRHNYSSSTKNCWKRAFYQHFPSTKFGVIDIWVWLEPGSDNLRIAGFGNLFASQEIIRRMDSYCQAVYEILNTFPGLCHIREVTVCPVCLMHQIPDRECGEFAERETKRLRDTLRSLEKVNDNHRKSHHSSSGDSGFLGDSSTPTNASLATWKEHRLVCRKNFCHVGADLLVCIPNKLTAHQSVQDRTVEFLTEEFVRISGVPSAKIENCICKIGMYFTLEENVNTLYAEIWKERTNSQKSPTECKQCLYGVFGDAASGVLTNVPLLGGGEVAVVVSCEHFMTNPSTMEMADQCPSGCVPIFVVGDETRWLYLADVVARGSQYETGSREKLQQQQCRTDDSNEAYVCEDFPTIPVERMRTTSSNCSSRYGEKTDFWDVSTLSLLCPLDPVSNVDYRGQLKIHVVVNGNVASYHNRDEHSSLSPMSVSMAKPQVEQSLRLMSYQRMASLSVDWGRVMQKSVDGLILVNVHGNDGSSGGAVVDREGRLVGILVKSNLGKRAAYVEPIAPVIRITQQHEFLDRYTHLKKGCQRCR